MVQETGYTANYLKIQHLPDPFQIALEKGYSKDPLGWDIGLAHQAAQLAGDLSLDEAHIARYGVPWSKWGRFGAEFEMTHWPEVLMILGRAGQFGVQFTPKDSIGYGVPLRECHDATHFGPFSLIKGAFSFDGKQGWTITNPQIVKDPSKPRGPFTQFEPMFGGSTIYYFNDVPETAPTTPPVVPPIIPPSTEPSEELLHLRSSIKLIRKAADEAFANTDLPPVGGGKYAAALRKLIATIDLVKT